MCPIAAASCLPLLHCRLRELSLAKPCALAASPSRGSGAGATAGAVSLTWMTSGGDAPPGSLGPPWTVVVLVPEALATVTASWDPQNRTFVGRFVG